MDGVYNTCKSLSKDGYLRTTLTSGLIGHFIRGVRFSYNKDEPALSKVFLDDEIRLKVETLKRFNYESQILSPRLKIVEFRGKEIVKYIYDKLLNNYQLMPLDCRQNFEQASDVEKPRIVCDFVAGMTDNYCIEFYGRLTSENAETIFKPF
jgi:dGTPase